MDFLFVIIPFLPNLTLSSFLNLCDDLSSVVSLIKNNTSYAHEDSSPINGTRHIPTNSPTGMPPVHAHCCQIMVIDGRAGLLHPSIPGHTPLMLTLCRHSPGVCLPAEPLNNDTLAPSSEQSKVGRK